MPTPRRRGRHVVDHAVVEEDLAGVGTLEAGDHPQRRRLAAARAAHERDELARARCPGRARRTAVATPKRLVTPRRLMPHVYRENFSSHFFTRRSLSSAAFTKSMLMRFISRDLGAAHRHVGPRDARAAPLGVGAPWPTSTSPSRGSAARSAGFLAPFTRRVGLERPRHAVGREDDVDGRALLLRHLHLVGERDADGRLAGGRHAARGAAGLGHLREVLVERVVVLEGLVLAEAGHVAGQQQVGGARRGRVRHHDVALVLGVDQLGPRLRRRAASAPPSSSG